MMQGNIQAAARDCHPRRKTKWAVRGSKNHDKDFKNTGALRARRCFMKK